MLRFELASKACGYDIRSLGTGGLTVRSPVAIGTAVDMVKAPLIYKGKVRELYDLGEHYLIVVTDRISAFDYVLDPPVPNKGNVLNQLSAFWFKMTETF